MTTSRQHTPDQSFRAPQGVNPRARLMAIMVTLGVIGVALLGAYMLAQSDDAPAAAPTAMPTATSLPPTEPAQEVALQDQLRTWLLTVEGVDTVQSFDIDVPDDEPPLVYAELDVSAGYNNTNILNTLVTKLNETLATTRYSDFVVILSDGVQVIEYSFDSERATWGETVLATLGSTES